MHYKLHDSQYVKSSNEVYFKKELLEGYVSLLHHGWLSQEGMSEAYNESHRYSKKVELFKDFLNKNPSTGNHFSKKKNNQDMIDDEVDIPDSEEYNQEQITNSMFEMHRKNLSQALYGHWIVEELRDRNKIGKVLFGPRYDNTGRLETYKESVDEFLDSVDAWRTKELYKHDECTGLFILSCFGEKSSTNIIFSKISLQFYREL